MNVPVLPDVECTYQWTVPHGRKECWKAATVDGVWLIERLEMPGTPWETVHVPTGLETGLWARNLSDARRMIGNGVALAAVEEQAEKIVQCALRITQCAPCTGL